MEQILIAASFSVIGIAVGVALGLVIGLTLVSRTVVALLDTLKREHLVDIVVRDKK